MFRCVRRTWMIPSTAKLKLSRSVRARRCVSRSIGPPAPPSPRRARSRAGAAPRAPTAFATLRRPPPGREPRPRAGVELPARGPHARRSGTRARPSPRRLRGAHASASASLSARRSGGRARPLRHLPPRARSGPARPPLPPRPRRRCDLPPPPRSSLAPALRARLIRVELVGLHDPLDEPVPDHVLVAEANEPDPVDRAEDVLHLDQPGCLLAGKVDLRHVAGDDDLRAEAEPRQKHLHLLRARVLGLVKDDEGVV